MNQNKVWEKPELTVISSVQTSENVLEWASNFLTNSSPDNDNDNLDGDTQN